VADVFMTLDKVNALRTVAAREQPHALARVGRSADNRHA
jgi:hypothetical protein